MVVWWYERMTRDMIGCLMDAWLTCGKAGWGTYCWGDERLVKCWTVWWNGSFLSSFFVYLAGVSSCRRFIYYTSFIPSLIPLCIFFYILAQSFISFLYFRTHSSFSLSISLCIPSFIYALFSLPHSFLAFSFLFYLPLIPSTRSSTSLPQ